MQRFRTLLVTVGLVVLCVVVEGCAASAADPTERMAAVGEVLDGKLYLISGLTLTANLASLDAFDPAQGSWKAGVPIPTARAMAASAVVGDLIYVIGGRNEGGVLGTVERFDPGANAWASCRQMPTARWGLRAVAHNGNVFAFGGIAGTGNNRMALDTVEIYDPATDTWTGGPAMPRPRHDFGMAVVGDSGFLIGGKTVAYTQASSGPAITDAVDVFDFRTKQWRTAKTAPSPRVHPTVVAFQGLVYVLAGMDREGALPTISHVYDPGKDTWGAGPNLQRGRSGQCGGLVGDTLYIVGGSTTPYGAGSPVLARGIESVRLGP